MWVREPDVGPAIWRNSAARWRGWSPSRSSSRSPVDLDEPESAGRWSGILAWYSLIHLAPGEMPAALTTLRRALTADGSMLVSFFTGPRLEAFDHPAAPAYRWPASTLADALIAAGFVVTGQRTHPGGQHASVSATPAVTPTPTPITSTPIPPPMRG